jgi:hypothetical protein
MINQQQQILSQHPDWNLTDYGKAGGMLAAPSWGSAYYTDAQGNGYDQQGHLFTGGRFQMPEPTPVAPTLAPVAPTPNPSNPGNINFGGGNFAPTIDTYKPFDPRTPTPGPDGSMMLNGGGSGGGGVRGQFAGTDAQGNPVYNGSRGGAGGSDAMMLGYFDANGNSLGSLDYQVANPYSGFQTPYRIAPGGGAPLPQGPDWAYAVPGGAISTGPVRSTKMVDPGYNKMVDPLEAAGLLQ